MAGIRITDFLEAQDKAMEMVYRTEEMQLLLIVPKEGITSTASIRVEDTEFMVGGTDLMEDENTIGVALAAYYLRFDGTDYKLFVEDLQPERGSD